jgi:predicted nucleotide-binding protein
VRFDLEFDKQETITKLTNLLELAKNISPDGAGNQFRGWHKLVDNFLKEAFTDNEIAGYFDSQADMRISYSWDGSPDDVYGYELGKARKALRLFLRELEGTEASPNAKENQIQEHTNRVFVVHGHDEAAREKVERLLERVGLEPVVINKKANEGKTIIEKIEAHSDVGFAVIVFTPDDIGGVAKLKNPNEQRPRQNVLIELGYFWGKLGRNRVCLLNAIGSAISSDLAGLGYTTLDDRGAWRIELARELKSAGYKIDGNTLIDL